MTTMDIAETLKIGVQNHEAGRLEQAEELYSQVLQAVPGHPSALYLLAIIASQRGEFDMAIELAGKAIKEMPEIPQYHNTIGAAFKGAGKLQEAVDAYKRAISLKPDYAEAYNNLADLLQIQGQQDEAIENYKQVIQLKPDFVEAYYHLGNILNEQDRQEEAIVNYKKAVRLKPDFAKACNVLGELLNERRCYGETIELFRRLIQLKPDYSEAYNNMAATLIMQGHYVEALENFKQSIKLVPNRAMTHSNMGILLLLTGKFKQGWKEYEWRLNLKDNIYRDRFEQPRWDGSSFVGKRLLVCREQGIGDSFQFVRYLPMVKERGGTVIFQDRKSLLALFRQFPGIDELVEFSPNAMPDINFDYHVSLLSLPGIFATTPKTIPAEVPYLYADPAKAKYWRNRLPGTEFKIGIIWKGAAKNRNDHNRSCALENFAPLARIDGVRLYGLQKGDGAAEVEDLPDDIVAANFGEQFEDFTDTSAAIENLDLVISVDTSVLHLAGAMGKPTWGLLPFAPDWRWLLERQDSPWYPTMKLFRQKKPGDWREVFARIEGELQILVGKGSAEGKILVE